VINGIHLKRHDDNCYNNNNNNKLQNLTLDRRKDTHKGHELHANLFFLMTKQYTKVDIVKISTFCSAICCGIAHTRKIPEQSHDCLLPHPFQSMTL
jgi:hypothetical protein